MFPQESSKMCQNIHSGCFWDFSLPTALWKFSLITWRRNAFQPKVWSFPSIFTHSLKCRWSSEGTEKSGKGLLFLGRLEWWLIIDETLEQGNESTISIVAAWRQLTDSLVNPPDWNLVDNLVSASRRSTTVWHLLQLVLFIQSPQTCIVVLLEMVVISFWNIQRDIQTRFWLSPNLIVIF